MSMIGKADAPAQGFASGIIFAVVASHFHGLGYIVSVIRSIDCRLEDALSGGLGEVRSWQVYKEINGRGSDGLWLLG